MATKSIAWNTGTGNITLTYQGQGDGTIIVSSDPNNLGSVRSQVINIKTTAGSPVVTRELTVSQAACPFPVGDVRNFAYSGSYQEVELPAGQYKLQCWGAQGGSNAADSNYQITAQTGGKGGYSEGIITLSQKTIIRVYVGGQGSSSAGGFNGGGSTTGSSTYNASNEQGVSRMGGGGGATDIRLSDGNLLSRMIVAGGGSGGAMCYKKITSSSTETITDATSNSVIGSTDSGRGLLIMKNIPVTAGKTYTVSGAPSGYTVMLKPTVSADANENTGITTNTSITISSGYNYLHVFLWKSNIISGDSANISKCTKTYYQANTVWGNKYQPGIGSVKGIYWKARKYNSLGVSVYKVNISTKAKTLIKTFPYNSGWTEGSLVKLEFDSAVSLGSNEYIGIDAPIYFTDTLTDSTGKSFFIVGSSLGGADNTAIGFYSYYEPTEFTLYCKHTETTQSTTESNESQIGFVGGGTNGGGYNSSYYGKQNGAGNNGAFGQGANQDATNYRYCSGAGGAGWYGGGINYSNSDMNACKMSGGGSGFVNTAESADNRPSGYTGLQLDSGTTYAGNQSFPAVDGGNEIGHSGDGYARITRIS